MSEYENLSIKQWALEDRPREKLLYKGLQTLSEAELIAILIGSGNKNESAVDLSKKILNLTNNNLHELGKLSVEDFKKIKGIGEAKAITIIAALELGRRRKLSDMAKKDFIKSSNDVFELLHPVLGDLPHEEFWVLLLNRSNKVIDKFRLSQGGISGTVADVRLILKNAIQKLASSVILCHNHPSGNLMPSKADKDITTKTINACKLLDINLLDHIIIAENKFFSFADEGLLE